MTDDYISWMIWGFPKGPDFLTANMLSSIPEKDFTRVYNRLMDTNELNGYARHTFLMCGANDYGVAHKLVANGLEDAYLLSHGKWMVNGYYFHPKSNTYTTKTQKKGIKLKTFKEFVDLVNP